MSHGRRDALLAGIVGLAALAFFLRTMYPGLVGSGDTPELQFAGPALGTPHVPGYPLYLLLSYAFSRLPIGSVAYRVNLMSGAFGAVAAALAFLLMRRLDCRPAAAAAVALALALGRVFWSQATIAEVYTLAAALLLGVLVSLASWDETGHPGAFHSAAAFAALGLAHHYSDVVTAAPALVLFVLLSPRRRELKGRSIALAALLLSLGVALYGLILLRTHEHAPYLGARAASLGELLDVMRGGRFGSRLFVFDVKTVFAERLPSFVRLGLEELGPGGAGLLALGLVALARRRPRHAALFVLGAAGNVFFALNYDVPDVAVFLLPAFVLLWPLAGVGLAALLAALERALPAAAVALLALFLPFEQAVANYRVSDHRGRTFEMRYFRALFESLPDRSALVSESYTVDQMGRYEMLGEGYAVRKDVVLTSRDADSIAAFLRKGYALFAFEKGRQELAAQGFRFAPVTLFDAPLADTLAAARRGAAIVLAATDGTAIGGESASCAVTVRVAGASGALEGTGEVDVKAGEPVGPGGATAPAPLRALCRREGALVEVNGRVAARVDVGVAAAVVAPTGRLLDRYELDADDGPKVPFSRRAFPLFRMTGGPACADVGNRGWVDVTPAASEGRILARLDDVQPFDASLVLYVARDRPLAPRLVDAQGPGTPRVDVTALAGDALARALQTDGLGRSHPLARSRSAARVDVRVNDEGEFSALTLDLGGAPSAAFVRAVVDRDNPKRAQVCALPAGGSELFAAPEARAARIPLDGDGAPFLGFGWRAPERDGPVEFRWTDGAEAEVLVPLALAGPFAVRVLARPAPGAPSPTLELRVNGHALEARGLRAGWDVYEWAAPAEAWRVGLNQLIVRAPGGVAIGQLRLRLP